MDFAKRWTRAPELQPENKEVQFSYDGLGNGASESFGLSVYYLHQADAYETHAVMLPDGWDEAV